METRPRENKSLSAISYLAKMGKMFDNGVKIMQYGTPAFTPKRPSWRRNQREALKQRNRNK